MLIVRDKVNDKHSGLVHFVSALKIEIFELLPRKRLFGKIPVFLIWIFNVQQLDDVFPEFNNALFQLNHLRYCCVLQLMNKVRMKEFNQFCWVNQTIFVSIKFLKLFPQFEVKVTDSLFVGTY